MKQEKIIDIVREICEFGCGECCMRQGSEQCEKNLQDYVKRIKEAEDAVIQDREEKDS